MKKIIVLTFMLLAVSIALAETLSHNIVKNSYMSKVSNGIPDGFDKKGSLQLEAVSPYTQCFEGAYWKEKQPSAAESCDQATGTNPYWFRRYYKGSRASRGGMASGWSSTPNGKILKISGGNSETYNTVILPFESTLLTDKVLLKAWVKIVKGEKVCFGDNAAGYGDTCRGYSIDKQTTDTAPEGWYRLNKVISIPKVTNLTQYALSMGVQGDDVEVYLALPYAAVVDNDSWMPSVTDIIDSWMQSITDIIGDSKDVTILENSIQSLQNNNISLNNRININCQIG